MYDFIWEKEKRGNGQVRVRQRERKKEREREREGSNVFIKNMLLPCMQFIAISPRKAYKMACKWMMSEPSLMWSYPLSSFAFPQSQLMGEGGGHLTRVD